MVSVIQTGNCQVDNNIKDARIAELSNNIKLLQKRLDRKAKETRQREDELKNLTPNRIN